MRAPNSPHYKILQPDGETLGPCQFNWQVRALSE